MTSGGGESEPLFTRNFVLSLLVNSALAVVFYVLISGISLYAVEKLDAEETEAGVAASAFVVGSLFSRLFAGRLSLLASRKYIVVGCLAMYVAASLLYLLAGTLVLLIVLRVVHGASFGFASTALSAYVFEAVPADKRSRAAGFYSMAYAVFPAIGPGIAIFMISSVGYWSIFVICALFSLAGLLAACALGPDDRRRRSPAWARSARIGISDVLEPRVLGITLVVFLAGASYSGILTFLPLFAMDRRAPEIVTVFFLAYSISAVMSRFIFGRIQDRFGSNAAAIPALMLFLCAAAILAFVPGVSLVPLAGVFAGFGFGTTFPIMQAIVVSIVSRERLAVALSTYLIMMDLGLSLGPVILGFVLEAYGYEAMFLGVFVGVCLSLVAYWCLHGRWRPTSG